MEIVIETLVDGIKLLPFLFITYVIMEYLEHKTGSKTKNVVRNAGKFGPLLGGILGIFPQCGFSAAASSFYSGRVITLGTLIAVFLSTSDEMLPILISEAAPVSLIIKILAIKLVIAVIIGFAVDIIYGKFLKKDKKDDTEKAIEHICEDAHCDCEHEGILKSSIKHTFSIFLFILVITLAINTLIEFIGEETLSSVILDIPVVGVLIIGLIGLIPNCASSVVITELYLSNLIGFGTMIGGLLVGSGVGLLLLFRTNKNIKENLAIMGLLYAIGVICGVVLEFIF